MLSKGKRRLLLTIGLAASATLIHPTSTLFAGNESDFTYLALGDSVAFGLNPTLLVPNQPPPPASTFVGYPEIIAAVEHLQASKKEVNASCPGETSSSFINAAAPDYGCHSPGPQGQPPYKTWAGLHTNYPGTQLEFAVSQLSSNKHINLVTLTVGSNDFLLLARNCGTDPNPPACIGAHVPGMLQTLGANLAQILGSIRGTAHYSGQLVLVGYYAPSPDLIPIAQALNSTILAVGAQFGTLFADGFSAFEFAAAPYGGDVCKAGLLVRLDANTCDIHPSLKGSEVLAATVILSTLGRH